MPTEEMFRPSGIERIPLSMQVGSPGRELLKTLLEPGRIFVDDWRELDEVSAAQHHCAGTKKEVYVYEWYEDLSALECDPTGTWRPPLRIWVPQALMTGGAPMFRHIEWRPGFCARRSHVVILPHTLAETQERVVLRVETGYPIDDTDDDYMPYSVMEFSVYACDNEDDQKQCVDDLSYETYVRMYTEGIRGRSGSDVDAKIAYSAFIEAAAGAFPDLTKADQSAAVGEGVTDKLSKEFDRVSALYYVEDQKRENGEENGFDFYEGYREGLSYALRELKNRKGE